MSSDSKKKYSSNLEERREWYREHAEEERARSRAYGASHREQKREAVKKCYYAKQEYYLEKRRQYVEENHEKVIQQKRLYRIRQRAKKEVEETTGLNEKQKTELYNKIVKKLCKERGVTIPLTNKVDERF